MKKWVLLPLLGVLALLGASLTFTMSESPRHGVVIVPYSTQEMPWDVGVRAHTNHLIFLRSGSNFSVPSGETPGSLSCVYQTVSTLVSGCPISSSTTVATGGSGIIAIVDAFDYPTAQADFDTFSTQFGLPLSTDTTCGDGTKPCFTKVFASGSQPRANCGWAQEAALDIEWSHAMAPHAQIVLVEAASNSFNNLFKAVDVATNQVLNGSTHQGEVSMSWGGGEFCNRRGCETSDDFHFQHTGVVYFAASGDSGGSVIYPSASPDVVSAGGTSVNRSGGNFTGESAWSSGGGGPSLVETEPTYQLVVTTETLGGKRGTPDLSFDSDPNTGVSVFDSTPCNNLSGWLVFGGTSVASPSLSGIVNLAGHVSSSTAAQGELNTIYTTYSSSNYSTDFFDITSGSNGFSAITGWDFATGIGSNKGTSGK